MDNMLLFSYTTLKMCNSFSTPASKSCHFCVIIAYLGSGSPMFRAVYKEIDMRFS